MTQTKLANRNVAAIGEEIGRELGAEMVRNFQSSFPTETQSFIIGRNIIDQILAQPGCVGIQLYNALNEMGQKTLVYVGIDANGDSMIEISTVDANGAIAQTPAIVADRVRTKPSTKFGEEEWYTAD